MLLGFFFAMRSCENFKVFGEQRTHPIRKRNMVFRKDGRILPDSLPRLHLADTIAITFEYQKRDKRNGIVTQWRTVNNTYCPVVVGAAVVRRLEAMGVSASDFVYKLWATTDAPAILTPRPPCGCSEVSSPASISKAWASTQSALDSTPFARWRPWRCISTVYRCTPSCCSVAGPATLSSATSGSKSSLSAAVCCPR